MQIRCTAYVLTQLLPLWGSFPLMQIAPWRKEAMIAAGLFGHIDRPRKNPVRREDVCA